jgi:hypothetical protein
VYSVSLDSNNFSDGIRGNTRKASSVRQQGFAQLPEPDFSRAFYLLLSPTLPVSTGDFKVVGNEPLAITFGFIKLETQSGT